MVNDASNKRRHWLSATLVLVAITALVPLRVEALDTATPEFLRGETRPKSVALLPPLGPDPKFAWWAGNYLEGLLNRKGYATKVLAVEQLKADSELERLALRANKRYNLEWGILKGAPLQAGMFITYVWSITNPLDPKNVRQRQLRVGEPAEVLASKLQVDALVFPRFVFFRPDFNFFDFNFFRPGNVTSILLDVGVVNGTNGDLEAYFLEQVRSWESSSNAMQNVVRKISNNFPTVSEVIKTKKAKGSTLGTPPGSLHVAARWGELDQVERFLSKGTDINAKDVDEGNTPLHWATVAGNNTVAELLIAKGADVNAKNERGNTPLSLAAFTDYKAIAELLIAKGAEVNAKNKKRSTPLMVAAFTGHKDIAELLIAKGAKVDAKNKKGFTPLSAAVGMGHRDVAELLIAKGADVNAEDKLYNTPLHWAATIGRWAVAELLIAKGADVNAENIDGDTPLSVAMANHHKEFAEQVKQHGGKKGK